MNSPRSVRETPENVSKTLKNGSIAELINPTLRPKYHKLQAKPVTGKKHYSQSRQDSSRTIIGYDAAQYQTLSNQKAKITSGKKHLKCGNDKSYNLITGQKIEKEVDP